MKPCAIADPHDRVVLRNATAVDLAIAGCDSQARARRTCAVRGESFVQIVVVDGRRAVIRLDVLGADPDTDRRVFVRLADEPQLTAVTIRVQGTFLVDLAPIARRHLH